MTLDHWALIARVSRAAPIRGRGRVALRCQRRGWRPADAVWRLTMRSGYKVELPPTSSQSWVAAFTGGYDTGQITILSKLIAPNSVVVDVGASLGLYTLSLAARACRVGSTVIAFDPVPDNISCLRRNVAANGLGSIVDIRQTAIGALAGETTMRSEGGGAGNAAVVSDISQESEERHIHAGNLGETFTVTVSKLDDELKVGGRCSVIKMDVEGYELDVLEGGKRCIQYCQPAILGEFNAGWLSTRRPDWEKDLWAWAERANYTVYEIVEGRPRWWRETIAVGLTRMNHGAAIGGELLLLPNCRLPELWERIKLDSHTYV